MKGDLVETFDKGGRQVTRHLADDRSYIAPDAPSSRAAASCWCATSVTMTTDAVLDEAGQEIPKTFLDAIVTSAIALHDVGTNCGAPDVTGSVYIVKNNMHGPEGSASPCAFSPSSRTGSARTST